MIVLAFFVVVGLALIFVAPYDSDSAVISGFISLLLAVLMLISIPFNRLDVRNFLIQRDALQATYTDLRVHPLEMATVANKIADYNANLAQYQYWNHSQWKWWIPDDVNKTQPHSLRECHGSFWSSAMLENTNLLCDLARIIENQIPATRKDSNSIHLARDWMTTNLPTLGGLTPKEFVMKSDDREDAEKVIKRILCNTLSGDYA